MKLLLSKTTSTVVLTVKDDQNAEEDLTGYVAAKLFVKERPTDVTGIVNGVAAASRDGAKLTFTIASTPALTAAQPGLYLGQVFVDISGTWFQTKEFEVELVDAIGTP